MAETTETLLTQKLDRSSWRVSENTDNFKEEKELTVEITLAEYRDLIKNNTESNYKIKEVENESNALKKENAELKKKVENFENMMKDIRFCNENKVEVESEVKQYVEF